MAVVRPPSGGQALIAVLALMAPLLGAVGVVAGVGAVVRDRIRLQTAVDAAAMSGAKWQARGLNAVVYWNYGLLAAAGGDILKAFATGTLDFALYDTAIQAQEALATAIPGNAAIRSRDVFSANMGGRGTLVEVPPPIHMYSINTRRVRFEIPFLSVKLWLAKDEPAHWVDQLRRGPLLRYVGTAPARPLGLLGSWLGLEVPTMLAVAQAMPAQQFGGGPFSWLGGELWNPSFASRLTPVTVPIPGAGGVLLH